MDPLACVLPEYDAALRQLGNSGASFTFFLHLPKTGGSSIAQALVDSRKTVSRGLPDFSKPLSELADPQDPSSVWRSQKMAGFLKTAAEDLRGQHVTLMTQEHTTYANAQNFVARLEAPAPADYLASVRPVRKRLVSAFIDYWTQVDTAQKRERGENVDLTFFGRNSPEALNQARLDQYLADSVHYLDQQGNIDGIGWFRAFNEYGTGVPFLMQEVFGGDVDALKADLKSKKLTVLPSSKIDKWIRKMTGTTMPRLRKSITPTPALFIALKNAAPMIDVIAQRDAPFDRVLGAYLRDRSFTS